MSASYPVLVQPAGLRFDAPAGTSVLLAAQAAGIKLPSSCRNGTCRACMCLMLEGEVVYGIEWPGLSRDEKEEGWILPCVAQPVSALEIQAPLAAPIEAAAPAPAPRPLTGARR
ncbi:MULTISPECIES: 2Fe-2S iron-sulfur cluster-binding protein [Achromobacter]|jgi:ferredoxin|uniref:2Fe-2S iron-sulfur cluster binding domain-containing protein n=3 Tax=Achromobacter denitrificans TaxID=32002 RepID=A0A3R9HKG9_ACHDE|nr:MULTISPECIES: 2Fe-2S iron-sulfur cluster-binding protein [Achromobacter]MBV2158075.1 2Fe-2S iron-sulfur cluster binding domain-containing protein [Achromobacter denitrificans]MDX3882686.1 2Fe-2S iron-sulfur cluster-binding protein [Achromobacter sp.]QCS65138.1 2Fe-2S iron-sulfur cluster binding domain-containing protein [Achromobacter denitrificans]QKQ46639.1 2Fe-2S iron-sulfur cluster binding domain-containing protein [Achromobacter denitrificans]RSE73030.1 ferredoxin [Achromobacter denitr